MTAEKLTRFLMFRYGGTDTGNAANQFSKFRDILDKKVKAIPGAFSQIKEAAYLDNLALVTPTKPIPTSVAESRNLLNDEKALAIFEGIMDEDNDHIFWANTTVFLGDLGQNDKSLSTYSLKIRSRVSANDLGSLKDAHGLMILFSLFLDARRSGISRALQSALLVQSVNAIKQLMSRGDLDEDVKRVDAAIKAAASAWTTS